MVPSLDRYGRWLADLITMVGDLRKREIGFTSLHENLDTTTVDLVEEFTNPLPVTAICRLLEGARRRNLSWVREQGLVGTARSVEWYASWDMPRLAAYGFPYAVGPQLDLCTDVMAFFFLFDDQFDGPLGRAPDQVARVCQGLIDLALRRAASPR